MLARSGALKDDTPVFETRGGSSPPLCPLGGKHRGWCASPWHRASGIYWFQRWAQAGLEEGGHPSTAQDIFLDEVLKQKP